MREHHSLGLAGSTGGVDDRGQLVWFAQVCRLVNEAWLRLFNCSAPRLKFSQRKRPGYLAPGFLKKDQMLYRRAVREYFVDLQKLFLILDHEHTGARIFQNVANLRGCQRGIDGDVNC